MELQVLPSSIDEDGRASQRQHLLTIVIDDRVALDGGSLAFSCSEKQRDEVRDVVLTHPHLDHIASLPIFIDDLFATLDAPLRIHATREIIDILERDIFNWSIYPRFTELDNGRCCVAEYREFERGSTFTAAHLRFQCVPVNHKVSANGYLISDGTSTLAVTGDTGETDEIWKVCRETAALSAIFIECAFPDEMEELARISHHLTPRLLNAELEKLARPEVPVYVINIKPMYRAAVIEQLEALGRPELEIAEIGRRYQF